LRTAAEVGSTANSYEILAKLAEGGMAEIFLARGASVGGVARHVVLKRVLRDRAHDANFVRMFLDEARLAAQLQHPNIAQVYDIGKLGDSYFFTMEYVHGETVRALLQRASGLKRPLPIGAVLAIAAGAAAGLQHAHDRVGVDGRPLGIVHRDVSPSNLMVSYEGHVKLVDFGVAKASDRVTETRSGTVKGKISYLSPEQARGATIDRRSDLFSLGIVLWEMLALERLYRRETDFEAMTAIVTEPTPAPSTKRPDVPPDLDALVLRLLEKSTEKRFQTGEEVLDAIEALAAKTGAVLSAASIGRVVKDLFGQRPEPWIDLEHETRPVTVTSQPVPIELSAMTIDPVESQLASVADLRPVSAPKLKSEPKAPPLNVSDSAPTNAMSDTVPPGGPTELQHAVDFVTSDPGDRLPTPFIGNLRVEIPPTPAVDVTVTPTPPPQGWAERKGASKRSTFVVLGALGGAIVAAAAVLLIVSITGKKDEPAPPPAPAPAVSEPVPAPTPAPAAVAPDPTPAAPAPEPELTVEQCAADAALVTKRSADCALAACRAKDATHARQWVKSVAAAKRAPIIAACQATKTSLDAPRAAGTKKPPGPANDCAAHPLDCAR
jgi:serine/threonine protein kinase